MLITPHTAGETRRYEDNVIDILLENLSSGFGATTVRSATRSSDLAVRKSLR